MVGKGQVIHMLAVLVSVLLPSKIKRLCADGAEEHVGCVAGSFSGSCTTYTASYGNRVLFGNNEDFSNPVTYIWTGSPGEGTYGGSYFGFIYGRPRGGVNEKGLAYHALALPPVALNLQPGLPSRGSSDTQFLRKVMRNSAMVEDAIEFVQGYNWGPSVSFQVLLAEQIERGLSPTRISSLFPA